ncbi:anti-sigma factor domain-containing protein [Nocardia sp. alder85J]|uniref:anti-sigma factor n=1 Tax=Nocardia sp. alder85J TaxID=2862949 RepID=UPI001CD73E46|nr:anti-sigma factor [Nocardia sp. alder85J]MCX4091145.1 anti-sigma factor [Nocardia sp. alder85J]
MSTPGRPDVDLLDLAYPYALDAVGAAERTAIEHRRARAHRLIAAEFDAIVYTLRDTLAGLTAVDAQAPPDHLEDRVQRALDRMLRGAATPASARWRRSRLVAAAAVIVLALGAGLGVATAIQHLYHPGSGGTTGAAAIDAEPDALIRAADTAIGGRLELHSSAARAAAVLTFDSVPAPEPGRCYQIWLVPATGAPRSAVVLNALPTGPVAVPFGTSDTLAVTVEPDGGSPAPTSTPIVTIPAT